MAVYRDYPYGNAQFSVEIGGIEEAAFEQVLLPDLAISVVEYRDGGDGERTVRKAPGPASFGSLVLKRGFAGSLPLYQWWLETMQGEGNARRDVTVSLLDEERNPVARWRLSNAFPPAIRSLRWTPWMAVPWWNAWSWRSIRSGWNRGLGRWLIIESMLPLRSDLAVVQLHRACQAPDTFTPHTRRKSVHHSHWGLK